MSSITETEEDPPVTILKKATTESTLSVPTTGGLFHTDEAILT